MGPITQTYSTAGELKDMSEQDVKALVKATIEAYAKVIKRPSAEWTRETYANEYVSHVSGTYVEKYATQGTYSIVLRCEDKFIIVRLSGTNVARVLTDAVRWNEKGRADFTISLVEIDGTTGFKGPKGWMSFDRRGIDTSFSISPYGKEDKSPAALKAILSAQLTRIADAMDRITNGVEMPAPLANFTRTAAQIADTKAKLSAGETVRFMPGGMGVGYELTAKLPLKAPRGMFSPAPLALKQFFGTADLYIARIDAD